MAHIWDGHRMRVFGPLHPISGYQPGSLTLVRNPSWDPHTDALRPAYVDRIEFILGLDIEEAVGLIERGQTDLFVFENPPPQIPIEEVQRFLDHPELGVGVNRGERFGRAANR
jgi:hypothetical protein